MKKKIITLALLVIISIPQVASAAWWNPFSWKIFKRAPEPKIEMVQTKTIVDDDSNLTDQESEIEKLRAEVEELKKQKSEDVQKKTISAPKNNVSNTTNINTAPKPDITLSKNYEATYQKIFSDYTTFRDGLRNDIDVINESKDLLDIQKERLNFLNSLLASVLVDIKELAKISDVSPKPQYAIDFYGTKYSSLKQDYENEKKIYQEKLQRQFSSAVNQASQSIQNETGAQNQVKQNKLNEINKKIADLNAKYAQDLKDLQGIGLLTDIQYNQRLQAINIQYNVNYNLLKAEWQQVYYSD